jgi:alkylation response protein AidB-like acyl-CoA dehydrogenase
MVGPVIIQFGNEEQKKRFLPRIANIDDWWCQGFSEPGAGSDLASLKTRAEKDGDHWIVNGQKTWTTLAQHADWIFALVRTSNEGKKQEGISFLLIDMKSPGVEVHPIQTMDGGHEINSVFFTDVKVPAENMIGEVNKGWTYAKFLLGNERLGAPRVGASQAKLQELKEIAKNRIVRGRPLWDHPRFRDKFVEAQIELKALEMTVMRVLSGIESGADQSKPDPATSVIKIKGAQMVQRLTELYVEAAGEQSVPWLDDEGDNAQVGPDWTIRAAPNYFNMRKSSIYGGSDQVQKGIISKAILGL